MVDSSLSIQEEISEEICQAKLEKHLLPERIQEIFRAAALKTATEFRGGSTEVYLITKDILLQAIEMLGDEPQDLQKNLFAVIEGLVEGFSWGKREAIAGFQVQIERLQTQVDHQERALQDQTDQILNTIETIAKQEDESTQTALKTAIDALRSTEEMTLMRQRYSHLRVELSILRASLIAQYGEHYSEIKKHLEEAKFWYKEVQNQSNPEIREKTYWLKHKRTEFEKKMDEAELALAQKERKLQTILTEMWHLIAEQA